MAELLWGTGLLLAGAGLGSLAALNLGAAPLRERLYRWAEDRPDVVRAAVGLTLVFLGYDLDLGEEVR